MKERMKIIIRSRPLLEFEDHAAWNISNNQIKSMPNAKQKIKSKVQKGQETAHNYSFQFQSIYNSLASSESIYQTEISSFIQQSIKLSVNCCLCTYGSTNSGKTYTLLGNKKSIGILPLIFQKLFSLQTEENLKFRMNMAYLEIYNEKLRDLLDNNEQLKLTGENNDMDISGLSKKKVSCVKDCLNILERGQKNRKYGERENHELSSRSHVIFRIYIQKWDENFNVQKNVINVVDLAGSQKLFSIENKKQTGSINKSLFLFSNVLAKLSENNHSFISYRDSKLTRLLEPCLKKDSFFLTIFCVSPALCSFNDTLSTLRLATKSKKIEIEIKEIDGKGFEQKMKGQIKKIKRELLEKDRYIQSLENKINQLNSQIENLKQKTSFHPVVLIDHENFMVKIGEKMSQLQNEKALKIKSQLMNKIHSIYQEYVEQIIKSQLGIVSWIKLEEICYLNLVYENQHMIQYRISVLEDLFKSLNESEFVLKNTISEYLQVLQQKKTENNVLNDSSILSKNLSRVSSMNQQATENNLLFSWGCKKDYRVFKSDSILFNEISSISSLPSLKQVKCGTHHSLALTSKGFVYGWGKNSQNQIQSSNQFISIPKKLSLNKIKHIAAGWGHSLALSQEGQVYSWGYGQNGQLGHGQPISISFPTLVQHEERIKKIYAGHSHSGFINSSNEYYAFGYNKDYRLMIPLKKNILSPQFVARNIQKAALGVSHSCLLSKEGKLYSGGVGTNGELGIQLQSSFKGFQVISNNEKNVSENSCQKVCPLVEIKYFGQNRKAKEISCGESMTAVIDENKSLYTFGKKSFQRLGHQNLEITKILDQIDSVELGYRHGFAINKSKKLIYGWGFNMYSQLGSKVKKDIQKPEIIQSLINLNINQISCGFFHSVGISSQS